PRAVKRGDAVASYPELAEHLPRLLAATDEARTADRARVIRLIREDGLTRECVPTEHLNDPEVWVALLEGMPLMALVRNLAKMTAVGLLTSGSKATKSVRTRLADRVHVRKARLHPLAILLALATYERGQGLKGSLGWKPVSAIKDALDGAFYEAFG